MGDLRRLPDDDDRSAQRTVRLSWIVDWLFARGHAADIVLLVMLAEMAWLTTVGRWAIVAAVLRLSPGAMMMLALRAALVGADWRWIALSLAGAFPPHLADLARGRPRRR